MCVMCEGGGRRVVIMFSRLHVLVAGLVAKTWAWVPHTGHFTLDTI